MLIHIFCTDNVIEYMKTDVSMFCARNRIIHHIYYSHTAPQSGVAERKYRCILHGTLYSSYSHACSKIFVVRHYFLCMSLD